MAKPSQVLTMWAAVWVTAIIVFWLNQPTLALHTSCLETTVQNILRQKYRSVHRVIAQTYNSRAEQMTGFDKAFSDVYSFTLVDRLCNQ